MLSQILPRQIDNSYRGYKPALWILGLLLLLRTIISINSIFNGYSVASTADGIPLDSFTPAGAQTVVSLFALSAYSRLVMTLFGVLALVRYRSMVPLIFLVLLLDHLGRMVVLRALPITQIGDPPASFITLSLLALVIVGLAMSVRLRPRSTAD